MAACGGPGAGDRRVRPFAACRAGGRGCAARKLGGAWRRRSLWPGGSRRRAGRTWGWPGLVPEMPHTWRR